MGQYYKVCLVNSEEKITVLSPYQYDNGAKLMEHSYINNHYLIAAEMLLLNNPQKVVWCGDYADQEDVDRYPTEKHELLHKVMQEAWDLEDREPDQGPEIPTATPFATTDQYLYIINHTKEEYIDIYDYQAYNLSQHYQDKWFSPIHPLSLLTVLSNGKGGGDYHGTCMDKIGSWCGDVIEIVQWKEFNDFYKEKYKNVSLELEFHEE